MTPFDSRHLHLSEAQSVGLGQVATFHETNREFQMFQSTVKTIVFC